jgi:hypothetical protein
LIGVFNLIYLEFSVKFPSAEYAYHALVFYAPDIVEARRSLRIGIQNCRVDNERLIKSQEENKQLNAAMLQSLTRA